MPYDKTNWTETTPINTTNLQKIEDGVETAQSTAEGITKSSIGLGNVDNVKQASKADFDAHLAKDMPHQFVDNGKTYRWGFRTTDGKAQFIYEEVIE